MTETRDFSDQMSRVDVGVSFGATLGRFLVEDRWTEGLRDVESEDRFGTTVRHRVLAGSQVLVLIENRPWIPPIASSASERALVKRGRDLAGRVERPLHP